MSRDHLQLHARTHLAKSGSTARHSSNRDGRMFTFMKNKRCISVHPNTSPIALLCVRIMESLACGMYSRQEAWFEAGFVLSLRPNAIVALLENWHERSKLIMPELCLPFPSLHIWPLGRLLLVLVHRNLPRTLCFYLVYRGNVLLVRTQRHRPLSRSSE